MKYYITIAILFVSIICKAQKLAENKTDEFTKSVIKRTDWTSFTKKNGSNRPFRSDFRISKIDENIYFELKMMLNDKVYSVKEGDEIMFLMEDESVISIKNISYTLTSHGEGATGYGGSANLGTHTKYLVSDENVKKLSEGKIKKIRVYTSLGYFEQEDKYHVTAHLKKYFELVNN